MKSWGGVSGPDQRVRAVHWPDALRLTRSTMLAVGNLRSYGDVCLASSGDNLCMTRLDRVLDFDELRGTIRCDAGISLAEISKIVIPQGWRLPVLPGTERVTLGGAIANDVHGKNHHRLGTFGQHVRSLRLQRTSGEVISCSSSENIELWQATIAGLGLTGIILDATVALVPATAGYLDVETIKFGCLDEFFTIDEASIANHEYTVAWFDCLGDTVRGIYSRANFSDLSKMDGPESSLFGIPFDLPFSAVNGVSLRLFNSLYFYRQRSLSESRRVKFSKWMFPLDSIRNWNRLYGNKGFRQYQCVVDRCAIGLILGEIKRSNTGSMLAVIKSFGDIQSPGLLSFPRPGYTVALDFPFRGTETTDLFVRLDKIVSDVGGAIYPAKDAHMSEENFKSAYPAWERFLALKDPGLESLFWQRVMGP